MNDQNNPNSGQTSDLNSILSANPQPPSNPLPGNSPLAESSSLDGGLMSPPISASPPTPGNDSPNPQPPANNPPPVDVPQFGASPFTPPLTTQSDPSLPQTSSVSSGSSGFGTILESTLPGGTNPPEQPQNFDWPKSPATVQSAPTDSSIPTSVINPETTVQSNFTPADLSTVQGSPSTPTSETTPKITPSGQNETPPTDLSHLVEPNMNEHSAYNPPTTQSETLIMNTSGAEAATATAQVATAKQGVPKWIIILGVVLLLAVAAASAYFILGIGRNSGEPPPASAPATSEQQQIVPPPATTPTPVATSSAQPIATGSAGFSGVNQPATSAADLLRQRQGL